MKIDGFGFLLLALGLVVLPVRWFLGTVIAAGFHEFCHAAAAWCMGCSVHSIGMGFFGAEMQVSCMSRRQELVCACAGPLGSLLLVCFLRLFPELGIMGLCQGFFNLLPLYPLDGGRILRCVAGEKTESAVRTVTQYLMVITAFAMLFKFPAGVVMLIWILFAGKWAHPRKSSCKDSNPAVQ